MIARAAVTFILAASLLMLILAQSGYSQKNNRNQSAERRENQRVQQAQQHLKQAQKELADAQKQLRERLQSYRIAAKATESAKTKQLETKEAAEDRLADSLGIASAIEKLQAAREQLKTLSIPIIERLHSTRQWQQAKMEADQATAELDRTEEDLELSEANRLAKLKQLRATIRKPYDLELAAVAADPDGKRASDAVNAATDVVHQKRKAISPEKVMNDPKVLQATQELTKAEAQHQSAMKALAASRATAMKAQNQLLTAQTNLTQARRADAADSNRPKKKR